MTSRKWLSVELLWTGFDVGPTTFDLSYNKSTTSRSSGVMGFNNKHRSSYLCRPSH